MCCTHVVELHNEVLHPKRQVMIANITWWHVDVSSQSSLNATCYNGFVCGVYKPSSSPQLDTPAISPKLWKPPKLASHRHRMRRLGRLRSRIADSSDLENSNKTSKQAELAHIYGYSTLTELVLPVLIFPNFLKCTEKCRGLLQASKSSTWGPKIQKIWPKSVEFMPQFR